MNMVEWERYFSWRKLVRLYAWWMRYKFNLRCKAKKLSPPPERQTKNLNADDLKKASLALYKIAQIESFQEDYKDLQPEKALSSKSSLLPLQPVLVEGILRVGH